MLVAQNNLAGTYQLVGRLEESLNALRDVYSGFLKLNGEEHEQTLQAANNYATSLVGFKRYADVKSLLRRLIPVAPRVLGDHNDLTLKMRGLYAQSLYKDTTATLDDLREAVSTLEKTERIARRVLGGVHPLPKGIEHNLQNARAALRAREETQPSGARKRSSLVHK